MSVFLCPTSWQGREILRDLFHERGWNVIEDPEVLEEDPPRVQLAWCPGRDVPWQHVLEGKMRANVHHLKTGLNRKADMHQMLEKHIRRNKESILASSLPETHVLDLNELEEDGESLEETLADLKETVSGRGELWVLKASESNRGMDVHLFGWEDIGGAAMLGKMQQTQCRVWLLQRCVDPPLLFRGRKFHLRVVALAAGDLAVHVHEHVVVIPAHSAFARSADGGVDRFSFLTNHCVQNSHADYQAGRFALLPDLCQDLHLSGRLPAGCSSAAALEAHIFGEIKAVLAEVFAATKAAPTSFFPLASCFELFGCDFLLDAACRVFLLEINSDPSMSLYEGPHLQPKLHQILADTLDVAVGPSPSPDTPPSLSPSPASAPAPAPAGTPARSSWPEWRRRNPGVSSVYVAGVPFLHAAADSPHPQQPPQASPAAATQHPPGGRGKGESGEGAGGAAESGEGERSGGFHSVYRRAPRYEGLGGLKVFRGLLRTSLAMKKTCDAIGAAQSGQVKGGEGQGGEGGGAVAGVARYTWYGEAAEEEVRAALGEGVRVVGGTEGVGAWAVQLGPYREVQWEEVLGRGMVTCHYMARKALLGRVSLHRSVSEGRGEGGGGAAMPLTLRVGGERERAGWGAEVWGMMGEAGSGWRVEAAEEGSGAKEVRVCRSREEIKAAVGEGGQRRSVVVQQWVPPVGGWRGEVKVAVLAVGKLAVYVRGGGRVRLRREGGEAQGREEAREEEEEERVGLAAAAQRMGAGGAEEGEAWAEGWEEGMRGAVRGAFAGALQRRTELMALPQSFELFAFTFLIGPPTLALRAEGAGREEGRAVPWLVKAEAAMEMEGVWGGEEGAAIAREALRIGLAEVQWPRGVAPRGRVQGGEAAAGGRGAFREVLRQSA